MKMKKKIVSIGLAGLLFLQPSIALANNVNHYVGSEAALKLSEQVKKDSSEMELHVADFTFVLNNKDISNDLEHFTSKEKTPIYVDANVGRTYMPISSLVNILPDLSVKWDEKNSIAKIIYNENEMEIIPGIETGVFRGDNTFIDLTDENAYAFLKNGSLYVPLRAIFNFL